jgi:hypothetical protein
MLWPVGPWLGPLGGAEALRHDDRLTIRRPRRRADRTVEFVAQIRHLTRVAPLPVDEPNIRDSIMIAYKGHLTPIRGEPRLCIKGRPGGEWSCLPTGNGDCIEVTE